MLRVQRSAALVKIPSHISFLQKYSDIKIGASDSDIDYIIESSLDKTTLRRREESGKIITTRREALSLYREIFRVTGLFVWKDQHGHLWRDVLRQSARKEFEAARQETDPELITRMLVVARDAVHRTAEQFMDKRNKMIENEAASQDIGSKPPFEQT